MVREAKSALSYRQSYTAASTVHIGYVPALALMASFVPSCEFPFEQISVASTELNDVYELANTLICVFPYTQLLQA